jgi:Uma2 family endonuclease
MSRGIESRPRKRRRPREVAPSEIALTVPSGVRLFVSPRGFWRLCAANRDLRLEREANGALVIMPPAAADSGYRNMNISGQLWYWNQQTRPGVVFDSSAGFTLPNSAVRAPDASWMSRERWEALPEAERRRFSHNCPDFIVELNSPSDNLSKLQQKMEEYIAQGIRLGWLIDPDSGIVEIYRPGRPVERLVKPATLSGEDVLPGFVLDLKGILFD